MKNETISNRDSCKICGKLRFEHPDHNLCELPQEWTREWLANYGNASDWLQSICDSHNAALAAAKQEGIDWADKQYYGVSGHKRIRDLEQQLAADRDQRKQAEQERFAAMEWLADCIQGRKALADAARKLTRLLYLMGQYSSRRACEELFDELAKAKFIEEKEEKGKNDGDIS